jgi:mono/diheme cytochrome c family protein
MRVVSVAASALTLALLPLGLAGAHEAASSRYNYRDQVRPLFVEHCGGCHHPGGPAPMSLLDYQEAVPWAKAIKLQVLEGRMPPYLPGDDSRPFLHRRGLTAEEIDVIVDWTVGGTPEGDPVAPEEVRGASASTWTGGTPDLVIEAAESVVLGEDESQKTACVVLPTGLDRPRVLSRLELTSEAHTLLRRATLFLGDTCSRGEPLLTWLPDQESASFPEGVGGELPASSSVALELRYEKGWGQEGERVFDHPSVGLWFASGAAPVNSMRIERRTTLERPATLIGLFPDVSSESSGAEPLRVEAVLPGGETELLLSLPSPDPSWVEKYFFRKPVFLPRGTELRISRASVWADFVRVASTAGNDDEDEKEH